MNRREALSTIGVLCLGASLAALGASSVMGRGIQSEEVSTLLTATTITSKRTESSEKPGAGEVSVNVIYAGMQLQTTGTRQEMVTMASPAFYDDLLARLHQEHPSLAEMQSGMQVLLNGMPPSGNPMLEDGDELDFIPNGAGG